MKAQALFLLLLVFVLCSCGPTQTPIYIVVTTTPEPVLPTIPPTALPTSEPTTPPTAEPTAAPPTETAQPTAIPPTGLPAPTATPQVTEVACDNVPVRGFGLVWANHADVKRGLGCPTYYYYCFGGNCSGEQPMVSAYQRFEHGAMIWVNRPTWEGTQWVYVLFEDGTYQRFADTFREGDPESDPSIVPPEGLYQPIRGFGKVWREGTGAQVRERLGWALAPEQGGDGAWQDFERGSMYWIGPADRIWVIYAYDTNWNTIRVYQAFEDEF